jgi:hypothetical protein
MQIIKIWHPCKIDGKFHHYVQIKKKGITTFYTDGEVVSIVNIPKQRISDVSDQKLKGEEVLPL